MDAFMIKTLKKIKVDAPKRLKELHDLCDDLLTSLGENGNVNRELYTMDEHTYACFLPLQLGCTSGIPKLMELSLSALHYLFEHGFIRGDKMIPISRDADGEPAHAPKKLMDLVIEVVCKCADEFDENVQLQVIKVVLTAVTSTFSEVHEGSLLLAVRACFHIHLISKSPITKTTAKAALTQMLSVANQRMELHDARARYENHGLNITTTDIVASTSDPILPASSHEAPVTAAGENDAVDRRVERKHSDGMEYEEDTPSRAETLAGNEMKLSSEAVHKLENASAEHGKPTAGEETTAANNEVESVVSPASITAAPATTGDLQSSSLSATTPSSSSSSSMQFPSLYHKDAYLLFRALCKLSMKGLYDDSASQDAITETIALQNKILSLELIFHILQNSGPSFRTGERFIYAIRHYLCVSLLGNCTSQVSQVTGLSLQIFVSLLDGFKDHLKGELEVFITNIFLRILESENTSFDHKMRVLEVFHIICTEPSALVEIFMNYDCELEAIDLYRRLVNGFARIAKNPSILQSGRGGNEFMGLAGGNRKVLGEEQSLRVKGLEGLVIILRSLLRSANLWQDIAGEQASASNNASPMGSPTVKDTLSNVSGHSGAFESSVTVNTAAEDDALGGSNHDGGNEAAVHVPSATATDLSTPTAAGAVASGSVVDIFDRKQRFQEEIEMGILKFNLSSKKGLAYLSKAGHVEMTPSGVAAFLRQYQDRLDKTAVGEYLGREREYENGFCIKVLHEYVDAMDFTGMAFDMAIRHFLNGFRLPGEAQKIDRLMEKFAERYYLQNRETFASADMAFILAFSTIMLQTNLHNPAIREDKRMTKEQFLKQNKGISSDGELPEDMLLEIYDRIAAEPISISNNDNFKTKPKKEEPAAFTVFVPSADQRRKDAFVSERKEMVRAGEAMFKQKSGRGSVYVRVNAVGGPKTDEAYARPMFEVVWAPILGVLSELLETYDDPSVVGLCITCFQYAIRLACRLDFPTPRHTFINALAKFTTLDTVREMQSKNVECIKLLLDIASTEGDFLDDSWSQVFQNISQLSRLQLFANGLHTDDMFFGSDSRHRGGDSSHGGSSHGNSVDYSNANNGFNLATLFTGPSRAETVRAVEKGNAALVSHEIDHHLIDRVFTNSKNLSAESVIHFVKSLCDVSMLEISTSSSMTSLRGKESSCDASTPRVFSLQKLVEVADCNMGSRPRIAWANIWALLAVHFTSIGVHQNLALAMFAIDSLKQLSIKFLQKEELSNFNFQRLFLKPFEVIIAKSSAVEIKDLVLRCIEIMIRACATNIRSGWKSIFAIFAVAAHQSDLDIATIAFDIVDSLIVKQFELLIYDFVELVNCLVSFVGSPHTVLSLKALDHIARCADHLARGDITPAVEVLPYVHHNMSHDLHSHTQPPDEDASVFRLWFPLLLGLSARVGDSRLSVRRQALETLGQILRSFGQAFSAQTWKVIFKGVLFPMIDSARTDFTPQPQSKFPMENPTLPMNSNSWIGTMGANVLSLYLEMFRMFRGKIDSVNLLPDLLNFLSSCINQETESLARLATKAWADLVSLLDKHTVAKKGEVLESHVADLICQRSCSCVLSNLCMDYGEGIGYVELVEETPTGVLNLLPECPLAVRRLEKEGLRSPSIAGAVSTSDSYTQAQEGKEETVDEENYVHVPRTNSSRSALRVTDEESWQELSVVAMTSMVVSLDFLKVMKDLFRLHSRSWELSHCEMMLNAIEASHFHARSFNENSSLRENLQQLRFIRFREDGLLLPHLLEQEVNSLSLLLDVIIRMYCGHCVVSSAASNGNLLGETSPTGQEESQPQPASVHSHSGTIAETVFSLIEEKSLQEFSAPWFKRISKLVFERYLALEELLQSTSTDRRFALLQHQQYKACVITILRAVNCFSEQQLRANKSWLLSGLTSLILCDNKQVRMHVSNCYATRINSVIFPEDS